MKTMNIFISLAMLSVLVLKIDAQDVEPGEAAAISTGVLLGTQAIQALSTNSKLTVVVERYKDTHPIPGLDEDEALKLPVEERRTPPFRLGKAAAVRRLMDAEAGGFSLAAASTTQSNLAPEMKRIIGIGAAAKKQADRFRNKSGYADLVADYDAIVGAVNSVGQLWNRYDSHISRLEGQTVVTSADIQSAKKELNDLRKKLESMDQLRFGSSTLGYFKMRIRAIYNGEISATPGLTVDLSALDEAVKRAKAETTYAEQVADILVAMASVNAAIKAQASYDAATHDPYFDDLDRIVEDEFLSPIIPSDLQAGTGVLTVEEALRLSPKENIFGLADAVVAAINVIYSSVLSTPNLGPLKSEMTQGLLAQNAQLDEVLETRRNRDRWELMNVVKSKGRLGDHSAIVYLDNAVTPVLKEAEFNPSEFIEATGLMYERAFALTSGLFGLPDGETTAGLNLYEVRRRIHKAGSNERSLVSEIVAAADELTKLDAEVTDDSATPAQVKARLSELGAAIKALE